VKKLCAGIRDACITPNQEAVMRANGVVGFVFVWLLAGVVAASCNTSRDFETELTVVRSEWSAQLASLRTRQAEYAARLDHGRAAGVADAVTAQAMARRLEVLNIRAQQALTGGDRLIDEVVDGIKAAKVPQEALFEGRVRMAEYFAAQGRALADSQDRLAQRLAVLRSEGGQR
jgi:hypothetical protein